MLQEYKQKCKEVVDSFLKNATRFDFGEYTIDDYNEFVCAFKIKIINELDVESSHKTLKGLHKGGDNDFFSKDEQTLKEKIRACFVIEINDINNLNLLKSLIENGGFATFKKDENIKEVESKFYYSYICGNCGGKGEVTCHRCNGKGKVNCYYCGGSGKASCSHCGGSGRENCSSCFGTGAQQKVDSNGSYSQTCWRCSGIGRQSCSSCSGRGKVTCSSCSGGGKEVCDICSGSGKVTCKICDGEGCLTDVYTIFLYTKPDYDLILQKNTKDFITEALQKTLIYNMDKFGELKRLSLKSDEEKRQIEEIYDVNVPFATFKIQLNESESNFILYGKNTQIFDAGGVLDKVLQADLEKLVKGTKLSFLNPFAPFVLAFAIKLFLKSEKNIELLMNDGLHKGKTLQEALDTLEPSDNADDTLENRVNKCYELLGRTFSKEYIQTTLQTLKNASSRINFVSKANWFLLAFFLSAFLVIVGRIGIFFSNKKEFTFKQGEILYLNPSIKNAKEVFDFGNFWELICFMPFISILIVFICVIGFGLLCNKIYWRLVGGKVLSLWINLFYGRYKPFFLAKSICGYLALCLFFYLCPIYFENGKLYGFLSKEKSLEIFNTTKAIFEFVGTTISKVFDFVFTIVGSIWQFFIGLF